MTIPIADRPVMVAVSLVYLGLVLAIGVWALRRTRDSKDFFIAGQGIGLLVTAMATMSASFSGVVFIGGPGLTYRMGISSLFMFLPSSFTSGMLCWVVAKRLRLLAEVGMGTNDLSRIELVGVPLKDAVHPFQPGRTG